MQPAASPPVGHLQLAEHEEWQHPAGVNMTASPRGGGAGTQSLARISWGALQGLQSRPIDGEPAVLRRTRPISFCHQSLAGGDFQHLQSLHEHASSILAEECEGLQQQHHQQPIACNTSPPGASANLSL